MLRTAAGLSALAAGTIVIGAGIGACILFRRPIGRAAKSIAREVVTHSERGRALLERVQEGLEDVRAEADAGRPVRDS